MEDKKAIDRPDLSRIWASSGAAGVTSIDAEKYLLGWVAEIPTYQHMNFLHNRMDKIQLALAERGFHAWGTDIKYTLGSLVWNDKDSYVYVSKVENPIQEPSVTSTHWVRSMCQLTVQEFLNIEKLIQTHEADKTNPHGVSAGQIGAYTKPETDTKISQLNTSLTSHANNKSNPHGVTAEQAGAIHTSRGGTYSGKVTFNHSETGFGSHNITNDGNGFNLKVGNKRLGLNTSGLPIYFDGTNNNNILFDTNFDEWRANTESEYSVPAPDVHIPFISDLNMIEGFGCVEYSRSTPATYIDKSGMLRTAAIGEPRFEKEGLLIEGQSTNLIPYSSTRASFLDEGSGIILTNMSEESGAFFRVTGNGYAYSPAKTVPDNMQYTASFMARVITEGTVFQIGFDRQSISVKPVGAEWKKYSVTVMYSSDLLNLTINSSADSVWDIKDIQVEALPFATSYIPTNGAAATRAADVCKIKQGGNMSATATMSLDLDFTDGLPSHLYQTPFSISADQGLRTLYVNTRGLIAVYGETYEDVVLPNTKKGMCAVRWDGLNVSIFNEGNSTSKAFSKGFPSLGGDIFIGTYSGVAHWLNGHIRNFRIWHKALTDKQISTLS